MNLAAQRKVTQAFIAVRPESIVFTPRHKEKKPAGGFVWVEDAARAPQTVTFIEPGSAPLPTVTLDGIVRVVEMQVVAAWDAAIERFDVFTHQGKDWEVVDLFYDNGYETRALVSGRG